MLAHWEQALVDIGFLDPAAPKKLMPRLNQLFNRARLAQEEVHILRGIAKAMTLMASKSRGPTGRIAGEGHDERGQTPRDRLAPMFSRLRSDIQCILDRDPAARSTWEVLTCYPGLHALLLHRPAHWFWTHGFKWLGRFISHVVALADRHRDPPGRR